MGILVFFGVSKIALIFLAPLRAIFTHESEFILLPVHPFSVCATFRLEMYDTTVLLFRFFFVTAQVTKPRTLHTGIGIEKQIANSSQKFLYSFQAEACLAQVCFDAEYSISFSKSLDKDDSGSDNRLAEFNILLTGLEASPLNLHL